MCLYALLLPVKFVLFVDARSALRHFPQKILAGYDRTLREKTLHRQQVEEFCSANERAYGCICCWNFDRVAMCIVDNQETRKRAIQSRVDDK